MLLPYPQHPPEEEMLKAVRCTVQSAINRGWCRSREREDMIQEGCAEILKNKKTFDPERGSWSTFCSMLTKGVAYRNWQKRKRKSQDEKVYSLDEIHFDRFGNPYDPISSITERQLVEFSRKRYRSATEWVECDIDLQIAIRSLPSELRRICELLLELGTLSGVAKRLNLSCKTIYRRRDDIREALKDFGLEEYL